MLWAILIPLLVVGLLVGTVPILWGVLHDHRSRRAGSVRYEHGFRQPRRMVRARTTTTDPLTAAEVGEAMVRDPVRVPATTSAAAAIAAMQEEHVEEVIVEGIDGVRGIATEADIDAAVMTTGISPHNIAVGRVAKDSSKVASPADSVTDAHQLMADEGHDRLPVVDEGDIVGVLRRKT